MVLLNLVRCRSITFNLSLPHPKYFQNLNSKEIPYTNPFTYVAFVAVWSGRAYILAIDYDRYCIGKLCSFESNESKYVHCECF
jgi:hypothetical protein